MEASSAFRTHRCLPDRQASACMRLPLPLRQKLSMRRACAAHPFPRLTRRNKHRGAHQELRRRRSGDDGRMCLAPRGDVHQAEDFREIVTGYVRPSGTRVITRAVGWVRAAHLPSLPTGGMSGKPSARSGGRRSLSLRFSAHQLLRQSASSWRQSIPGAKGARAEALTAGAASPCCFSVWRLKGRSNCWTYSASTCASERCSAASAACAVS